MKRSKKRSLCYKLLSNLIKVTKKLDLTQAFDVSLQLLFISFALIISQLWGLIFYQTFHMAQWLNFTSAPANKKFPRSPRDAIKLYALFFSSREYLVYSLCF